MNTPNKLTVIRMILVPIFMAFALIPGKGFLIAALAVFALASITDWLDGKIARATGQVTTFGKFMDPLADKMLTTAAFLVFMDMGLISPWVIIIVLFREFAISGIRLVAAGTGDIIAASIWGKLKTVSQMLAIIVTFILLIVPVFSESVNLIIINVFVWISTVLTLTSGADYIYKSKHLLVMK